MRCGTASVRSRVDSLISYGIVTETQEHVRPFKKMLSLTPKGRRVAALISQICDVLEE